MNSECGDRDLVTFRNGLVVWGLPGLLVLGGVVFPGARPLLWAIGFFAAGAACVENARRCGRTHCYITGPLYLGLSAASVLIGLGVLSWSWWSLLVLWGAGTFLAHLPEFLGKRYLRASS
ncbi:MAG: hypothetical protein ACYTDU_20525 [Planctomycetota bacterium]